MAKKKTAGDADPLATSAEDIVIETPQGVRTVMAPPDGTAHARIQAVGDTIYEHVAEDAQGRWVYRAL